MRTVSRNVVHHASTRKVIGASLLSRWLQCTILLLMEEKHPRLMSAHDVAEQFNVDRATVTRWAQSGRLPEAFRVPGNRGARLFWADDVEEFADTQLVAVTKMRLRRKASA